MNGTENGNDVFDPYYKWLGIPPREQPPNHYRLLGIELFEPDSDVISNAADQRMAHVRTFQTGPNATISQGILNEIAAAKVCLLNPERKREYDAHLRTQIASTGFPMQAGTTISPVLAVTTPPDPPPAIPISNPIPPPSQGLETAFPAPPPVAEALQSLVAVPPQSLKQARDHRHRRLRMSWSDIGAIALTLVVVVVVAFMLMPQDRKIASRNAPSAGNDTTQGEGGAPDDGGPNSSDGTTDGGGATDNGGAPDGTTEGNDAPSGDETAPPTSEVVTMAPQPTSEDATSIEAPPEPGTLAVSPTKSADYFDLLSRVDLDRDVVSGKWTREGNGLTASPKSRVRLPVKVNGGYDLLVTFTRSKGNGDMDLLLPVGSHQCALFFSAWRGGVHGLDIIDGQEGVKNPINTRPGPLTNGQKYTALVKVRLTKDKNASIEVLLDNSPIVRWQGKEASLVLRDDRMIPPYQIGLSAWDAEGTFHSAHFRPVSGDASWIGGGELVVQAVPTEYAEGNLLTERLVPVPDPTSQDKARTQAEELFGSDYAAAKESSEKLAALASKVFDKAQGTTEDASFYVLLDLAKTFSVEAGNVALAMRAVDEIGGRFQCNVLVMKVECIAACAKSARTSEQMTALLTTIEPIIQASLAEADFDTAKNLNRVAIELARKIRDRTTLKQVAATNREIEDLERQYHRDIEPAMEVLKRSPKDPTANLVVGKYRCFRGNWEEGLPMLALSDSELKSLAATDLTSPTGASEQKRLADDWWNFASKHEEFGASARQRASVWYRKVLPTLTGIEKEVATKRIAEAAGGDDDDGPVVKRLRFFSPESLKAFLPTSAMQVSFRNGAVVLGGSTGAPVPLVYNGYFEEIKSVRIVGGIVAPEKFNFRVSVGPINMILNWERADENHFRCDGDGRTGVAKPRILVPGRFHEILVEQDGDKAVVSIDGKPRYTCVTKLQGTISIYPYNSVIAVREIVVEGRIDPNRKVTGPSHNNVR